MRRVLVQKGLRLIGVFALAFAAGARAQIPGGPGDAGEVIDQAVEETVENEVEQTLESDVEDVIETAVEQDVADDLEQAVEQGVEDGIDQAVEQAVEEGASNAVEDALESSIVGSIEDSAAGAIETGLAEDIEDAVLEGGIIEEASGLAAPVAGAVRSEEGERASRAPDIEIIDGWRAISHEWVVVVDADDAPAIDALGVTIVDRTTLSASGDVLFVVSVADDDANAGEVESVLSRLGGGRFDRNHVYDPASPLASPETPEKAAAVQPQANGETVRIGLIDTAIDARHERLAGLQIVERDFVTISKDRPRDHGTAVASIMAEAAPDYAALNAKLDMRAASVFFRSGDKSEGATTASLIRAIDWMRGEGVTVVNFSLAGPPNRALEAMISSAQKTGMVFVAAVGNDGPAARPLYPAAYDGVVGVTAVDQDGKVFRWALRGPQVDIAARGVNVEIAQPGGGYKTDSGTSLAAPLVSVFLAGRLAAPSDAEAALEAVRRAAAPAPGGRSGRDDRYGAGILRPQATH